MTLIPYSLIPYSIFNINVMKRKLLTLILAICALTISAQDAPITVKAKGATPTISDFAWALLSHMTTPAPNDGEEECINESANAMKQAWIRHGKGQALRPGETLTVDNRNGFVCYEYKNDSDVLRTEMCYWNEADGKHKLIAYCVTSFRDGRPEMGQYDGLSFYRYSNATKKMDYYYDYGFETSYMTDDGAVTTYSLPRTGKDIIMNLWYKTAKKQKILKWNGHGFSSRAR